ncbi:MULTISPECIES: radical SAM family heme chaperone HemW [Luteimonas]|uniref:radical SAM family heme chaperone HemW n=1 Tax=Luteimonas TaxID=83614 RepID=UPI000C7DB67F|nr:MULTISPECIES: radical SAM family heme chaperone HemW [Luteimonas]
MPPLPPPPAEPRPLAASAERLIPPPLALYVHLPWCVRKCPYCDFNSHEFRGAGALPFDAYIDALVADLEHDLPLVWGRTIHSVFFGGGTPSLFPADAIARFLQAASARLRFAPGCEVTLETNPGTAEHGRFEDYLRAGVNRISFGIQTFDDACLQRLGRIHDSAQAVAAVQLARDAGFDNFNLDLMYALPGQTLAMAADDVARAIALAPTHISHYQLTLEPNTVFAARPPDALPDDDLAWDMQEHCQAQLAAAGYAQYEVSAYAQPGRQCAHNLNYWRFGDYLGIGAGAHGKITLGSEETILRRWKHKHPTAWLATAGRAEAIGDDDRIAPARRPFEYMLNTLRLVEGFRLADFEARTGLPRAAIAAPLAAAVAQGWLDVDADRVRPTALGQRFTNDVVALFLED